MVRVLELYSGIGGMHFAMKELGIPFSIAAAMDINTNANHVYKFNFPEVNLLSRNIEGLTAIELDKLDADVLLMSPPCQPFTRLGKQGASSDPRARSFLCLLNILKSMDNRPKYILMENVKGFESSDTRNYFVDCLQQCQYDYQEFLLTPTQFGIPNSRLRYYLLAVDRTIGFPFAVNEQPLTELPDYHMEVVPECKDGNVRTDERAPPTIRQMIKSEILGSVKLVDFLQNDKDRTSHDFLLPVKILRRFGNLLDIVYPESDHSCCFTKGYSHLVEGTGSVLTEKKADEVAAVFSRLKESEVTDEELLSLGLRYFTPAEISRLLCFPWEFRFPDDITIKQRYKLLGNSLNVRVVSLLLKTCFFWNSESASAS